MKFLKYLYYTKVLLIILNVINSAHAKVISECATVTSQTSEFITNPNTACSSLYPYIYCNSALSTYCTLEECSEEYECEGQSVIDAPVNESPAPPTSSLISQVTTSTNTSSTLTPGASVKTTASTTLASGLITTTTTLPHSSAPATTTAVNMRAICKVGVYGNYPYAGNCRYYYRCSNGYHWLQDCGFRMYFDVVDGYCKSTKVARCSVESSRESFW